MNKFVNYKQTEMTKMNIWSTYCPLRKKTKVFYVLRMGKVLFKAIREVDRVADFFVLTDTSFIHPFIKTCSERKLLNDIWNFR